MRDSVGPHAWPVLVGLMISLAPVINASNGISWGEDPLAWETNPPTDLPNEWGQVTKLLPSDWTEPGYLGVPYGGFLNFGSSLAADGDTIIVGTAFDACSIPTWVYVFERQRGNGWIETAKLAPSDGQAADVEDDTCNGFGHALAVDDSAGIIVVGNPTHAVPNDPLQGAAYIYERTVNGTWVETQRILSPVEVAGQRGPQFGRSVAVSGDTVVIAAPKDDPHGKYSGTVFVYESSNGAWVLESRFEGTWWEHLGNVAIDGDVIAASASPFDLVYVFERGEEGWHRAGTLTPPPPVDAGPWDSEFGFSVDVDANRVIVGAPEWSPLVQDTPVPLVDQDIPAQARWNGAAYVFHRVANGWELEQRLLPQAPLAGAEFGKSVELDGHTAVIGAPHWPHPELTFGTAYVFERDGGAWSQRAQLLSNETSEWDEFGWSLAVAGTSIVIGAPFDDNHPSGDKPGPEAAGKDSGVVFTFEPAANGTAFNQVPTREPIHNS